MMVSAAQRLHLDAAWRPGHATLPLTIGGAVQRGRQLGRTIGFPTANVALPDSAELYTGIYASTTLWKNTVFASVSYIGRRPVVQGVELLLEVHILDFNGDLYDERIDTTLYSFIRGDLELPDLEALKAQIKTDIQAVYTRLSMLFPTTDASRRSSADS